MPLSSAASETAMPPAAAPAAATLRRDAWRCLLAVLAIKLGWLAADTWMRLFLGDSGSYLHSALTGWVPEDRSFLYGWMIGATAVPAGSIHVLLWLQTLFGVASAMLLYAWLQHGLALSARLATIAAALFALEPAQIFYERMMMAEATGFLALASFFLFACLYVRSGLWRWMALYVVCGLLAISMRVSLMPVVVVFGLLAPTVRFGMGKGTRLALPQRLARLGLHTLVAALLTFGLHSAYKQWYGWLANSPPAYIVQAGMFRLGLVLPLVKPEHLLASGVDPAMLDELTIDLHDPRARESHLWVAGGFQDVLRRHTVQPYKTAGKISIRAVRDDPFGLVRLGVSTLADYFEPSVTSGRLQNDLGRIEPTAEQLASLRSVFGYDATGIGARSSPATHWFELGAPWLIACLFGLAPLALVTLALGWRLPGRDLRVLLCLISLGLVAQHVLFSHIVSFRYLHPLPWFVLANAGLLVAALAARSGRGRGAVVALER